MTYEITVLRRKTPEDLPYEQTFRYDARTGADTVASALININRGSLTDVNGNKAEPIAWECSCLQAMCGSCAMVINRKPALACETFVRDLGDAIEIRPLSKFHVINDLVVDRGIIHDNACRVNAYIKEHKASDPSEFERQYSAAKCLKCGLCLEICPNYTSGERFFGALFANDCYLIATRSGAFDDAIREDYDRHFAAGCSKSLACVDICPMKIPTLSSMAKLNRGR